MLRESDNLTRTIAVMNRNSSDRRLAPGAKALDSGRQGVETRWRMRQEELKQSVKRIKRFPCPVELSKNAKSFHKGA